MRARHRAWFAEIWRDSALSDDLVEQVGRTHDDHLDALENALAEGDDVAAGDVCIALCRRWQFVEASAVGARWTSRVLERPGLTDRQRARLEICHAAFMQGADWDATHHEHLRRVLAGDAEWTGLLSLAGAITAYAAGDVDLARRHLDEDAPPPRPAPTSCPRSSPPGPWSMPRPATSMRRWPVRVTPSRGSARRIRRSTR